MYENFTRYRIGRAADEGGGFGEILVNPVTIWGSFILHDSQIKITDVDESEDIQIGDIIVIQN